MLVTSWELIFPQSRVNKCRDSDTFRYFDINWGAPSSDLPMQQDVFAIFIYFNDRIAPAEVRI